MRRLPAPRPWHGWAPVAVGAVAAVGALLAGCGSSTTAAPPSAPPQSTHTADATCRNAIVSPAVKAALVQADGRAGATEVAGATFYGTCGYTSYAVTAMTLAPGGTGAQSVAFQDQGAYPELFTNDGSGWALVTRAATPTGCPVSTQLPAALRTIWQDCAVSAPATTTSSPAPTSSALAACERYYAGKVFVRAQSAIVHADGSAVLTGAPVTVHCGGPDDFQFVDQAGTRTVDLAARASITVIVEPNTVSKPLPVAQLPAYVSSGKAETDVFLLTGTQHGAVFDATAIAEQYHP